MSCTVFCTGLVIDGVWRERPSELFIVSVVTVLILVYLIVNYVVGSEGDIKLVSLS